MELAMENAVRPKCSESASRLEGAKRKHWERTIPLDATAYQSMSGFSNNERNYAATAASTHPAHWWQEQSDYGCWTSRWRRLPAGAGKTTVIVSYALIKLSPQSSPQHWTHRDMSQRGTAKQKRIQTTPHMVDDLVCDIGSTHVINIIR
jgi:hypothetical protein